ncbi:MAG: flagellar motor switch protein FliN [Spirochaetaceae bacterium]|jgi:flagellar motor switch protein FliN/FliY|nr:flagellar motor switch protein FliN [Spirochaetaceae bacterium]
MSDGALSQDEIDALLAGVDSSGGGLGSSGAAAAASPGVSDEDRRTLQNFLTTTVDAQSSNLSMMTGAEVSLTGPQIESTNRDNFLRQLPDMVTAVKADFTSGFPGEHMFLLSEDTAKSIASLMNKEENITLDAMTMSVIGEVISQLVGTQITALTQKTGNKSIASTPPEAANMPKAAAALPGDNFMTATYQLSLGDEKKHQIWEIFGSGVSRDIVKALNAGAAPAAPNAGGASFFGGGMDMPNMGMMGGAMPNNMGGMMGMTPMGQPSNVQQVQFPSLVPQATSQEQGNIGLIMDVFMEMTVELGRTKKLIKEILGMGEGTIIELDKLAGEPVDILVNHKLIAKGEVVVIDENFGVRVTEIVSPMERMNEMG